jgi:hypothetical protein
MLRLPLLMLRRSWRQLAFRDNQDFNCIYIHTKTIAMALVEQCLGASVFLLALDCILDESQ